MMQVGVTYQIHLLNSNVVSGSLKCKIGTQIEDIQLKILQQQGIKNFGNFIVSADAPPKISQNNQKIVIIEVDERRGVSALSEKASMDSQFQIVEMEYEDQAKQFLAVEPQKPPLVKGAVNQCNKFFCCFDSTVHLLLQCTDLKFYSSADHQTLKRVLPIGQIIRIRTFRKQRYFFLSLSLDNENIEFKFTNSNMCKEWTGYLTQAMKFNKFLDQKKLYSRAESFRVYMQSLTKPDSSKVVNLTNQTLEASVYQKLPQEDSYKHSFRKIIKLSQFKIISKIGSGSFSVVYLVEHGGKMFAMKQLSKQKLLMKNQLKYALTQLNVLKKCRKCPFVIPLQFAFQTMDSLYLVLKNISTGDLGSYLKKNGPVGPSQALSFLQELVYAIQYLHKHNIIYRDLKPENIMLDSSGHIYLIDFGLAKQLTKEDQYAESFLGTPLYLPPERFVGSGGINYKSDIYGVGCVFYQVLHGHSPFQGGNYHSVINKIKNDQPEISRQLPINFISFLKQTLAKEPGKRLQKMRQHDIFMGTDWTQVTRRMGKGLRIQPFELDHIQISYEIDKDYDEFTFPKRLVKGWYFDRDQEE